MSELRLGKVVPITANSATIDPIAAAIMSKADVDWKALCMDTKRRLDIAQSSLEETRKSADEMRGRMTKYKQRLDSAQGENSRLQATVVELHAKLEAQAEAIAQQDAALRDVQVRREAAARKVHEFRQSILDGPIWELFGELVVRAGGQNEET